MIRFLLLSFALLPAFAMAESEHHEHQEHREHGAHVHGHATLNIVWSGDDLQMAIESPSVNLLGFEHAATTDKDKKQLADTVAALRNPAETIVPNRQANCKLMSVEVESALLQAVSESEHSDFDVTMNYQCSNIDKLASIDLSGLFSRFKGLEDLDVVWASDKGQSATELNPNNTMLLLD